MNPSADFICLSYKNFEYLIEKKLVGSSQYLGTKTFEGFSREISIDNEIKNLINLDFIISKTFNDSGKSEDSMILKIADCFYETTAEAFVKSISLNEFRFFGNPIDNFSQNCGILAVRCLENNKMQYLIDLVSLTNKVKNISEL